ncbi:MAG: TonB-dependent receptor [Acidobacteriota bacterium]
MTARALLLALTLSTVLAAEEPDLKSMDLEQLMNIRVTSVQRKEQSLSRTAAAVTVITREDIRRSGVSTMADALRLAPGLNVARVDAGVWAVGSRGFNGQFANKLLVLVDGRSVYEPINSGVLWETLDLMLADIERIEVIRGPGAVMWGANAVNGVINIITRRAEDTLGGYAEAGTGTEDRMLGRFRWGQQAREGLAWRLSSQYARRERLNGGADSASFLPESPWASARLGFRMDWDRGNEERLEVHLDAFHSGFSDDYSLPFPNPAGKIWIRSRNTMAGGSVLGRWIRPMKGGLTTVQFYHWDLRVDRTSQFSARVRVDDLDVQHRRRLAQRHELILGAGLRGIHDRADGSFAIRFQPVEAGYYTAQVTVQDEWEMVRNRLFLSGGFRVEQNKLSGPNLQPTARILWALGPKTSVWGAVSRAVRTPSRRDLALTVATGTTFTPVGPAIVQVTGNPEFESERLRSYEAGFRHTTGRLSWDLAAFWSLYRNYQGISPAGAGFDRQLGLVVQVTPENLVRGHGYGTELAVNLDVTRRWRLSGAVTAYQSKLRTVDSVPAGSAQIVPDVFPRYQGRLMTSYQFGRRWQANGIWYTTTDLLPDRIVKAHQRLDVNVQWRASEWGGASMGIQNVTGGKLYEFRPEDGASFDPMGRALFVRWQWWF